YMEGGEWEGASGKKNKPAKNMVRACHGEIEQSGTLERPLHQCGKQRESDPNQEIAGGEPNRCSESHALRVRLSANTGVHEKHWRRRRRHHADHHHGPTRKRI